MPRWLVVVIALVAASAGLLADDVLPAGAYSYDATAHNAPERVEKIESRDRAPQGLVHIATAPRGSPFFARAGVATESWVDAAGTVRSVSGVPEVIYRGGSNPANLQLRPGENARSFRDPLSNPMQPGSPVLNPGRGYIGIDTSKLPPGSVVPDGKPDSAVRLPGHISVYIDDWETLQAAIIEKGKFPK